MEVTKDVECLFCNEKIKHSEAVWLVFPAKFLYPACETCIQQLEKVVREGKYLRSKTGEEMHVFDAETGERRIERCS